MNILRTLIDIEEEKAKARIVPIHTLIIADNLQSKVEERVGKEITFSDFYKAIQRLDFDGRIHLGDTPTDQYCKVIYNETQSSL